MSSSRSYEFTGEMLLVGGGAVLHRIRAVTDLPRQGVRAGDVGGWVESTDNLSGDAWVSGDARVYGDARVSGNALVSDNAWVSGDALVYGDARVSGDAWVYGNARVSGNALVSGDAQVCVSQDVLTVGPIGSESVTATLFRTAAGHTLRVGCWGGHVDDLAAEVERRSADWTADPEVARRRRAEYTALETLCSARIAEWAAIQ